MRYGGTGLTFWLLWSVLCVNMAVQDSRYCQSFVECDGIGLTLWSILCAVAAQGSRSGQSGRSYVSWRHKTRADGTRLALRSILCATDGIGLTFWPMLCAVAAQDSSSGWSGRSYVLAAQDSRYGQSYVLWLHRIHVLVNRMCYGGIGLTFWSMLCAVAAQDAHSGYHGGVLCAMAAQDSRYGQSYVIWRHRTHFLVSII